MHAVNHRVFIFLLIMAHEKSPGLAGLVDEVWVILITGRQWVQSTMATLLNLSSCFNQSLLSNMMDSSFFNNIPVLSQILLQSSQCWMLCCCCCLFVLFSKSSHKASLPELLIPANTKHDTMETCRWPPPCSQYQISVKLTSSWQKQPGTFD